MTTQRIDLPQGTLDLLSFSERCPGPTARVSDFRACSADSDDVLLIQQGSLYPALHRLERRGWIKAKWGASENNRRAKYYELTKTGQRQLATRATCVDPMAALRCD